MSAAPATYAGDPAILWRLITRLRSASDAEWDQIASAVDPLRGGSVSALWQRAQHRALWFTPLFPKGKPLFDIHFAIGEVVRGFWPVASEVYLARGKARAPDVTDRAYREAFLALWELALTRRPRDDITAEAVLIAASGASRANVDAVALARAWSPLAAVVPLASVRGTEVRTR